MIKKLVLLFRKCLLLKAACYQGPATRKSSSPGWINILVESENFQHVTKNCLSADFLLHIAKNRLNIKHSLKFVERFLTS